MPWCPHVSRPRLVVLSVCNKMTKYRPISPFLCMDMTYITCLLKEGFGFKDNTVLQVSQWSQGTQGRGQATGQVTCRAKLATSQYIITLLFNMMEICIFMKLYVSVGPWFLGYDAMPLPDLVTAHQEGEQRGDQLGFGGHVRPLPQPQHPLRPAATDLLLQPPRRQPVPVGARVSRPPLPLLSPLTSPSL